MKSTEPLPQQFLLLIEHRLNALQAQGHERFHICAYNGIIDCMPVTHTYTEHVVFHKLPPWNPKRGYTANQWNQILTALLTAKTEAPQCHYPHQQSQSKNNTKSSTTGSTKPDAKPTGTQDTETTL